MPTLDTMSQTVTLHAGDQVVSSGDGGLAAAGPADRHRGGAGRATIASRFWPMPPPARTSKFWPSASRRKICLRDAQSQLPAVAAGLQAGSAAAAAPADAPAAASRLLRMHASHAATPKPPKPAAPAAPAASQHDCHDSRRTTGRQTIRIDEPWQLSDRAGTLMSCAFPGRAGAVPVRLVWPCSSPTCPCRCSAAWCRAPLLAPGAGLFLVPGAARSDDARRRLRHRHACRTSWRAARPGSGPWLLW